jgi:hypothetical protein
MGPSSGSKRGVETLLQYARTRDRPADLLSAKLRLDEFGEPSGARAAALSVGWLQSVTSRSECQFRFGDDDDADSLCRSTTAKGSKGGWGTRHPSRMNRNRGRLCCGGGDAGKRAIGTHGRGRGPLPRLGRDLPRIESLHQPLPEELISFGTP